MTEREVLKLALEALDYAGYLTEPEGDLDCNCLICQATVAVKEALAQPEQEPVAWIRFDSSGRCRGLLSSDSEDLTESRKTIWQPLYTTPPQRTWVGLTDEEFQYCVELKNPESIAEEVEAKLKEKNGYDS